MAKKSELKVCLEKYPELPKLVILKMDIQRRGVQYTDKALEQAQDPKYQHFGPGLYGRAEQIIKRYPAGLLLRDGTPVLTTDAGVLNSEQNPYIVDAVDGKIWIFDNGEPIEECDFWLKPDFYGKKTSRGTSMEHVANARPHRFGFLQNSYCHFWDDGNECRFCSIVSDLKDQVGKDTGRIGKLHYQDIYEATHEALKEQGRWLQINVGGGSDHRDGFETEVNRYIDVLKLIGKNFKTKRFTSQIVATAFSIEQLKRIREETGLTSYCTDIEVWNKELFEWICPGKAKEVGRDEWINRLIGAVEIFGKGNVYTNIVAGVEMAKPHGFKTVDEAVESTLEGAEFLAKHGVVMLSIIWHPRVGSHFYGQQPPPLEYCVRIAKGLNEIRKKYGLTVDCDDYRHCGNHGDTDLARAG